MKKSKNKKFFYAFVIVVMRFLFKLLFKIRVYGIEHFEKGGAILAANHSSYLDPPLIAVCAPEQIHFLAKGALFKSKLFARLIAALNTYPLKGSVKDLQVFKTIDTLLKEEKKVVIFPEGTRGFSDEIGPIKRGVAFIFSKAQGKIIPTYVYGTYKAWNRKKKLPRLGVKLAVVFGSPIYWEEFLHLEPAEAEKALMARVQGALKALKEWYNTNQKGSPP